MSSIKGFWQHENGTIYAVESDSFGKVLGGVGPLDPNDLRYLEDYEYKTAIFDWLQRAFAEHKLRRINLAKS